MLDTSNPNFIDMMELKVPSVECEKKLRYTTSAEKKINAESKKTNIKVLLLLKKELKEYLKIRKKEDPNFNKTQVSIFTDISLFRDFKQYYLSLYWTRNYKIDDLSFEDIMDFINMINERYSFNTWMSTILYEAIIKKFDFDKKDEMSRSKMLDFNAIYHLLSEIYLWENVPKEKRVVYVKKFKKIIDNTFEMVRWQNNYSFEDILWSMLYKVSNDFPWFDYEAIKVFFSIEIADNVKENKWKEINIISKFSQPLAQYVSWSSTDNLLLRYIDYEKVNNRDYWLLPSDITKNIAMFRWFIDYCIWLSRSWKLIINWSNEEFINKLKDFWKKHFFEIRQSSVFMDEIRKKLDISKWSEELKAMRRRFKAIYNLTKTITSWKKRKAVDKLWNKVRAFEHLKLATKIILDELPNPNLDKIYIAMLHDLVEDFDWVRLEWIEKIFWKKIANWVKELTKIDWRIFLEDNEKFEVSCFEWIKSKDECKAMLKTEPRYKELVEKWKKQRDVIYFWHLKDLSEDELYVKFADRIHNLRTLPWTPAEEIARKIIQTEKYFLNVAYREKIRTSWKCLAYDLMLAEINKLKKYEEVIKIYNEEHLYVINK